jgi:L-iditol 2-dehydrogenase
MKAVVQTDTKEVTVQDIEQPIPENNEVLIRVENAGVCGSDAHAYMQMDGFSWITIPRVMGHEYCGTVVETGSNVSRFDVGDIVVEAPIHPCGECHQCEIGEENVCQQPTLTGMHNDGAYAEFTRVQEDYLVPIPTDIPTHHAAITEPLSIATRAVYDRSGVTPGDPVVVQGPGPIGVLSAALLDSLGAEVIVSGIGKDTEYRLPLMEELGIDTVNIQDSSLDDYVDEKTDGLGVETVFDTTGHKTGIESAVNLVRKGGEIVVIGLPGEPSELFFPPIVRGELDIKAAYGATRANFKQAIRVLQARNIDVESIIDTEYDTDSPEKAFEEFMDGKTCKPLFSF